MWFCKGLLLIFFIVILPYIIGLLPTAFLCEKDRKPGIIIIAGWFLMFTLFQLIAVPIIILQGSFTLLVIAYDVLLCICAAIIIILAVKKGKCLTLTRIKAAKDFLGKKHNISGHIGFIAGMFCMILLLLFQMGATFSMEHYDGDDAYYVAASVATDLYDTMYVRDNYTGYPFTLESRHALSPTPVFIAWISRMTGVHATIIAHSILGPFWFALMYLIYWQIADRLLRDKKQYRPWFMSMLMLWFLFGNVSIYTTETFALTRIWQGKGLFAAIIIPTMFLALLNIYDKYVNNEKNTGYWILLVETVFSAVFATSTSIFLTPVLLGMTGLIYGLRNRSIKLFLKVCACATPALLYGVMYIFLR